MSLRDLYKPYLGKTKSEDVIQILHEDIVFSNELRIYLMTISVIFKTV